MKRSVALACCILTTISVFLTGSTLLRFNTLTLQRRPKLFRQVWAMILNTVEEGPVHSLPCWSTHSWVVHINTPSQIFKLACMCVHAHVFCFCLWLSYTQAKAELVLPVNTHQCGICYNDNWTKSIMTGVKTIRMTKWERNGWFY